MAKKPGSITWNRSTVPGEKSRIALRKRDPFYHTARWRRTSRLFLQNNPLCILCRERGITEASAISDHIIPKDVCDNPYDIRNLQPLCKKCHAKKSAQDKKHFAK